MEEEVENGIMRRDRWQTDSSPVKDLLPQPATLRTTSDFLWLRQTWALRLGGKELASLTLSSG